MPLRTAAATTALALGALVVAGCGKTEIDAGKAEAFVRRSLMARSADCPGGVEVKKGKTVRCGAVLRDGRHVEVTLHIVDGKGRVQIGPGDVRPG